MLDAGQRLFNGGFTYAFSQAVGRSLAVESIAHRQRRQISSRRVSAKNTLITELTDMILEIADIRIQPGQQAAFESALQQGLQTVISKATGFQSCTISHGIESPERYVLQIFWATLENHTVDFRQSPAFAEWRALVGPFFAVPPTVEHFDSLPTGV